MPQCYNQSLQINCSQNFANTKGTPEQCKLLYMFEDNLPSKPQHKVIKNVKKKVKSVKKKIGENERNLKIFLPWENPSCITVCIALESLWKAIQFNYISSFLGCLPNELTYKKCEFDENLKSDMNLTNHTFPLIFFCIIMFKLLWALVVFGRPNNI